MAEATTMLCPACATPREAGQTVCATCGRVFDLGTRTPATAGAAGAPGEHFATGQALSGGRYRVLRPLSQGGMGVLYLATDQEAFGRTVVVKTLLNRLDTMAPDEAQSALQRFVQEARTLASLRYPTIPQIYSYFQDGPLACMVMEYIDGQDLSHQLSRGDPHSGAMISGQPYPLADVLEWAVALCRTLEYLAGASPPVVHRDIKPANLIRDTNSGQIYLVDFGAAKASAPATPGHGTAIFGTPGYAAPEQYRGESGPASDIYALAATLYHLATDDDPGEHPFAFPKIDSMGALGRVLQDALGNDPAQRPTAGVLRRCVEALLAPDSSRTLITPDGAIVQGELELARWCERHWEQARGWLYTAMPTAVERELVKIDLASTLRDCASRHPKNRDRGLDEAIARLDPKGFGTSDPLVRISPDRISLSGRSQAMPLPAPLRISNGGRRYVQASLNMPLWLRADISAQGAAAAAQPLILDLKPGQEVRLSLTLSKIDSSSEQHDDLVLRFNRQTITRPVTYEPATPSILPPPTLAPSVDQQKIVNRLFQTIFILAILAMIIRSCMLML